MERLTPVERAVFVLREAFGYGHREIAATLDVSETNSRQLYRRAAERLRRPRRHGPLDRAHWRELVERFLAAARDGDLPRLEEMLAADVVSWADGGGKVVAARRPVVGRSHVARYMSALSRRFVAGLEISVADVNGEPAALFRLEGSLAAVFAVEIADGKIAALRIIANPDKLDFIGRQAGLSHSGGVAGSF
jgi:ketosteroid isomerase-like protein